MIYKNYSYNSEPYVIGSELYVNCYGYQFDAPSHVILEAEFTVIEDRRDAR